MGLQWTLDSHLVDGYIVYSMNFLIFTGGDPKGGLWIHMKRITWRHGVLGITIGLQVEALWVLDSSSVN